MPSSPSPLGQADADVEKLKADIRSNIEREVKVRSQGPPPRPA
ncbi:trigger factor domain protein [Bordetella holmesii 30539]|nr:trigger factor domain protein [Bordetella holmesii 30539]